MTDKQKKNTRKILMILGPAVVLALAGWFYLTGGRYISTENAYVKTDIVSIVPEVAGTITSVYIQENQAVRKGDVLFAIDRASYEIAQQKAHADLIAAAAQIGAEKARYRQKEEDIAISQIQYDRAKKAYDRRDALKKKNSPVISPEEMDNAVRDFQEATKRITLQQQEQAEILAMLDGDPDKDVKEYPLYKAAKAALDKADLDVSRTQVRAPADGTVRHVPHAGDYALTGLPVTSLAVAENQWVEANYKETELTQVKTGQPVDIEIDAYPGHVWTGTVESLSPATESEFSVLPAQNSSGNWVKVVQRIPVRIAIRPQQDAPVLRAGMSAEVTVDTGSWPHMPGH